VILRRSGRASDAAIAGTLETGALPVPRIFSWREIRAEGGFDPLFEAIRTDQTERGNLVKAPAGPQGIVQRCLDFFRGFTSPR